MSFKTLSAKGGQTFHAFFLLFFLSLSFQLLGQYPNESYNPATFGANDVIKVEFYLAAGTYGPELVLVHDYSDEGFTIDAASTPGVDVSDSDFGDGTTLTTSVVIDHEAETITLTLTRQDEQSITLAAGSKGGSAIDIEIETVQSRIAAHELRVFPNPAQDYVHLQFTGQGPAQLEVRNLTGQVVWQQSLSLTENSTLKIPVHSLSRGLYFLSVRQANQVYEQSLVLSS